MKLTIDIPEETAACLWADNWGEKKNFPIERIIEHLAEAAARRFQQSFPDSLPRILPQYRASSVAATANPHLDPHLPVGLNNHLSTDPSRPDLFQNMASIGLAFPCSSCLHVNKPITSAPCESCTHYAR
jgi:hypothetical protein